jgi:hypothetical protein
VKVSKKFGGAGRRSGPDFTTVLSPPCSPSSWSRGQLQRHDSCAIGGLRGVARPWHGRRARQDGRSLTVQHCSSSLDIAGARHDDRGLRGGASVPSSWLVGRAGRCRESPCRASPPLQLPKSYLYGGGTSWPMGNL